MLSNQIIIYDLKMKTYQQLWQSLTPLYDAGEAQAIVRTVLDVKYGMTLTDIIGGKVNELSSDEETKLEEIVCRLQKGHQLCGRSFLECPVHVLRQKVQLFHFLSLVLRNLVFHLLEAVFEYLQVVQIAQCTVNRFLLVRNLFDITFECTCTHY